MTDFRQVPPEDQDRDVTDQNDPGGSPSQERLPGPVNAAKHLVRTRRFLPRTVLMPLVFLVLHWTASTMAATFYLVIYVFVRGKVRPLEILGDQAQLEQILLAQYPIISVIYALILIPVYALYLFLRKQHDARTLWLGKPAIADVLPAIAVMIGVLGVTNVWFNMLMAWGAQNATIDTMIQDYLKTAGAFSPTTSYFWLILGISIMAPVSEELLFRGIIQGELRRAMPEWAAIVIQGLVFALFHMQPIQISYVILPGLLLGLAYAWTRSLWVPIIMHISFNFLGSVLPALIGEDETLGQIVGISEMAFILIGILCLIYLYQNRRGQQAGKLEGNIPQSN